MALYSWDKLTVWQWCWHIMSVWGLATAALLLWYQVASPRRLHTHPLSVSPTHTHTHIHFSFSLCGRKVAFKLSPRRRRGCISGVQEVSPRVEWCSNHLKTNPAAMKFHHKGLGVCAHYPACVPDVIKMSLSICNMFLLRVSKWRTKPSCSRF